MRVAVTGAAGYLGRPLVRALAEDERVEEVVAIDRRPVPGVRWIERDVRDPQLDLQGIDALIHLAAVVLGRGREAHSVNVDGSRNVFAAAIRGGATTIVHASSGAAYGCTPQNNGALTEDAPLRPEPPFYYPQTKVAVERMLDGYTDKARVVRMRPVSNLGPGAPLALGGRVFPTLSDYDPLIQFVWVDDTVDAFRRALHSHASGAFNVAGRGPVKASEVPKLLGVRGIRLPHRVARVAARATMHPGWADMGRYPIVLDTTRAERELGWRPTHDCKQALTRFGELLRRREAGR